MHVSKLLEIIQILLEADREYSHQTKFEEVANQLNQLSGNPQNGDIQRAYASAFEAFNESSKLIRSEFQPAQLTVLREIGAQKYFADDIAGKVSQLVNENPLSPSVVHEQVFQLVKERKRYVQGLSTLKERLEAVGIKAVDLDPGTGHIAFTIPRDLFGNKFDEFISELKELRFIIRAFSEATTGHVESYELRQLSTSDPVVELGMNVATIVALGGTVTWILNRWKTVEEIREIRARTKAIKVSKEQEILKSLDDSVEDEITRSINAKVEELLKNSVHSTRRPELCTHLEHAIRSLFARIERGMTVEIRFLPASKSESAAEETRSDGQNGDSMVDPVKRAVDDISRELVFPPPQSEPLIPLPRASEKKGASNPS